MNIKMKYRYNDVTPAIPLVVHQKKRRYQGHRDLSTFMMFFTFVLLLNLIMIAIREW